MSPIFYYIKENDMKILTIREIKFNDVYKAAEILKAVKIDIDPEDITDTDTVFGGVKMIMNIVGNAGSAKKEVNEFLGSLFNISGKEFGELNFIQSVNCMKQFKNIDGLSDFFNTVKNFVK